MKNSKFLRNTMAKALTLQAHYNHLGASSYQSVRNPIPMHQLVLTVLPKLPALNSTIEVKKETKMTALGKSFIKTTTGKGFALDVLGLEYWKEHSISADDIVTKLRVKGFIARRSTVVSALSRARNNGAQVLRFNESREGKTVSLAKYFIAA